MNLECILDKPIPLGVYSKRAADILTALLRPCHFTGTWAEADGKRVFCPTGKLYSKVHDGPWLHVAADGECQLGFYSYKYYNPFLRRLARLQWETTDEEIVKRFADGLDAWAETMSEAGVGEEAEARYAPEDPPLTIREVRLLAAAIRGEKNELTGRPENVLEATVNETLKESIKAEVAAALDAWEDEKSRSREEASWSWFETNGQSATSKRACSRLRSFLESTGRFSSREVERFLDAYPRRWFSRRNTGVG